VLPIHPRAGEPAHRIIVRGVKGSRAPLRILPGLMLHEGAGFTPLVEALHRGEAVLGEG
jgi:tRNA1(Val) A37 N6-methylase TrmN6